MGFGIKTTNGKRAVVVDGVRTPFSKSGGPFKNIPAQELGRLSVVELMARTELQADTIDEVIFGNCGTPAEAANLGRVISLSAGIPNETPALTVHRNCASGLESVVQAYYKISAGMATTIVAGGAESMSQYPLFWSPRLTDIFAGMQRTKSIGGKLAVLSRLRPRDLNPRIALMEGLTDPVCGLNMGQTAEKLAREFNITREQQDEFALLSHKRVVAATKDGKLGEEMSAVYVPPKYSETLTEDFGPRAQQTMEALAKLRPVFERRHGTVTAGNSSMVTDGACALLIMEEEKALAEGYQPLGVIRSFAFAGLDPARMGLGPAYATPLALKEAGVRFSDINLVEINEAFSAQVLANEIAFASDQFGKENLGLSEAIGGIDRAKLNVNGGAIALGHPVGVSGSRLVLTALKELRRRQESLALVTLCVGGGQGAAMILEAA